MVAISPSFLVSALSQIAPLTKRAAPVLPAGWTYQNCYKDSSSSRLLPSQLYSGSANSLDSCVAKCNTAGYVFAGAEYGAECWCANSLNGSLQVASCAKPCSGDSSQTCGDGDRISVFSKTGGSSTSSYQSYGCYVDSDTRVLPQKLLSSSSMTTATCQSFCASQSPSLPYFGTENGNECWCGSSLPPSSALAARSECQTACAGDSTSRCGGGWRISVYGASPSSSSASASSTTSSTPSSSASASSSWTSLGCYVDQNPRTLSSLSFQDAAMTPTLCQQKCTGYTYSGVESATECYCGNSLSTTQASTSCSTSCSGDSTKKCGGTWAINIYKYGLTSASGSASMTATSSSASATASGGSTPSGSSGTWWIANGSNTGKIVVAHFIVGNAYSRTSADWTTDIKLAAAQGIDAFALNLGIDSWQPARMQNAYDAASALSSQGITFKMFLSFDMTSLNCGSTQTITALLKQFATHPAQLKTSAGEMWVSTFAGGECGGNMWKSTLDASGYSYRFIPAFFNDISGSSLKSQVPAIGGDFLWGGGWPSGNTPITWDNDAYRIARNGLNRGAGDLYMASVSPWFFVHLSSGRNQVFRFDDWLYTERWEMLHDQRANVDVVQVVTWNDWGESHYIASVDPIAGDIPAGAFYATPQYDHTAFLYMTGYYASYYKTGNRPTVTFDKIFMWGRAYSRDLSISDSIGPVQNAGWVSDTLFVILFATGPAQLTVTQGGTIWIANVVAGPNKLSHALVTTTTVTAVLNRNGQNVFTFSTPLTYGQGTPSGYNFNAITASGP
ncbi:hypothetical protein FRB95_010544 [Tulasnella sp. JGI-2019a]|nr:hypothetical protein FRB95_010544 [Tulasnella sp. JGI-2019a]